MSKTFCGYCKAEDSKVLYPTIDIFGNHFTVNHCNKCQAYFLAPRPTDKQLAQAYDSSYYGEKDEKFEGRVEGFIDYFRRNRAKRLHKHLKNGAKVLDIGCGNGKFLKSLTLFGKYELNGIEMEGNSANRAAKIKEIKLKIGSLKPDDFQAESLDAVTLFHVFEHLTEPMETLEIITKIVKKDGIVMMSFPNIDSFQSRMFKGKWLHLDPPRHLFFFSPNDFKDLMEVFGFELITEKHWLTEQNPYGMVQSSLNLITKKREVLYEALKGNTDYVQGYSKASIMLQRLYFIGSFPLFIFTDWVASWFKKGATVEFIFRKK